MINLDDVDQVRDDLSDNTDEMKVEDLDNDYESLNENVS